MKHIKRISSVPGHASQDPTIGQILAVVASVLTVIAQALIQKDS